MSSRAIALRFMLAAGLAGLAAPVMATRQPVTDAEGRVFGDTVDDPLPEWKQPRATRVAQQLPPQPTSYGGAPMDQPGMDRAAWEEERADWLAECRQRFGGRGKVAGGVVGGLVGGIAGSAIAGRGHRTIGGVIGGVTGAVAGAALGDSSDRNRARDYCESYLDRHLASYGQGYGSAGYGSTGYGNAGYANPGYGTYAYPQQQVAYAYAMQPMMVMVPVAMTTVAAQVVQQQPCTEVVEEWVPVARPARRYIPRRIEPGKRVRVYPDKRVRIY